MNVQSFILVLLLCASAFLGAEGADTAPAPTVMPPIPRSPIEDFRRWLQMPPADREKALADYSAAKQKVLRQKLQAYEAMRPEQRDARLRALELRWYLQPLMSRSAAQRGDYLKIIPARLHEAIKARLAHWDRLSDETRREILADERKRELATGYFAQVRSSAASNPPMPVLPPPHPRELEANLNHWGTASPAGRDRMLVHLATFFGMSPEAQRKALLNLPENEREEIEKTLEAFSRLSLRDRQECVDAFQRLATMNPQERASFLRNAARWQQISPAERAAWRELVVKLPPMPPEPVPMAPMPQASMDRRDHLAGATGSGDRWLTLKRAV